MTERERELTVALYMCAAHCQGGHSAAGTAAALAVGVPFPLCMGNLAKAAKRDGFSPRELWPWWAGAPQ